MFVRANFGYQIERGKPLVASSIAMIVGALIVTRKLTKVNYLDEGG